jgi:hypothetical protein
MRKLYYALPAVLFALLFHSCGDVGKRVGEKLEDLGKKTQQLDSIVNYEVSRIRQLDSLVNMEDLKLQRLDSLIDRAGSKADSVLNIIQKVR